VRPRLPDRVR